jgi:hypothetical protein
MLRFRRLVGSSADFPHMIGLIAPKRPSDAFYRSGGTGVWENTTQLLQYHGVDTAKIHNTFRNILNYDVQKTAGIVDVLTRDNIDIGKAVGRNARLLSRPPEVVSARLASLKAHRREKDDRRLPRCAQFAQSDGAREIVFPLITRLRRK